MSIKQIRIVKIVRMILMSIYFYFIWRIPKSDEHFFIIATIIFFCAIAIGEVLPKEYKAGNTFLDYRYKWLEVALEMTTIFVLAGLLIIIYS